MESKLSNKMTGRGTVKGSSQWDFRVIEDLGN